MPIKDHSIPGGVNSGAESDRAQRNPILLFQLSGSFLLRLAERTFL
jgi:hypothetical protein